jgi:hypothetical protein
MNVHASIHEVHTKHLFNPTALPNDITAAYDTNNAEARQVSFSSHLLSPYNAVVGYHVTPLPTRHYLYR